MTSEQAQALRDLIGQLVEAACADEMKGGGDPADAEEIEAEYATAKGQVEKMIHNLTEPPELPLR